MQTLRDMLCFCLLCCWVLCRMVHSVGVENKYLKFDRNRSGSMANKFRTDQNTVYVEYCRSCDSHSWCTHHDESKYHDTFLKLTEMLAHRIPELEIIGNMVPSHLIPFKIAQNKYIDSNTNKYVIFPHIGAFEVVFRGKTLFSKKDTHTWPSLPSLLSKIGSIVDPAFVSPSKANAVRQEQNGASKHSNSNSFVQGEEQKIKKYKSQQKGFTLTDHFKMYRPKNTYQDKQWLTEKHQSQASMRQISEMGRLDSRQKSDRSSQSKKTPSDLAGEYKLKELLKIKGKLANDHGKKQMIIRLDSIQEENLYEEGAGATHRTPEKSVKRKKMKEIDEQIDSLEKKFKNFQNRVHDIHNKNKEFEQRAGSGEIEEQEKSKFRQIIQNRRNEKERNPSTKNQRESQPKPINLLADKTNKLEQYLNFSEQEKNDKLHRIYGQWKLIKQTNNKNKKLLKAKKQQSGDHSSESSSSSDSKDYSNSQSPSTAANIIPFRQKNEKMMEKKIKDIHKKMPKYSSIERYNKGSDFITKTHNQTQDNFYKGKNIQKSQESDFEGRVSSQHPNMSKLIKKSINTLSMDALKSLAHPNLPRLQGEVHQDVISPAAKANIGTINKRINLIQQKLKQHKAKKGFSPSHESHQLLKDKSISKKSASDQEYEMHERISKNLNKAVSKTNLRNSNASINTVKKNYSQEKPKGSNFSELARPETKKIKLHKEQGIKSIRQQKQQWTKPHQSKRKQAKYIDTSDNDHFSAKMLKKNSVNSQSKLNILRQRIRKAKKQQQQSKNMQEDALGYERQLSQQQYGQKGKYEYHPHVGRQSKPKDRKFKDWKQSSPVKTVMKSKQVERKITVQKSQDNKKNVKAKESNRKIKKPSTDNVRNSVQKRDVKDFHKEQVQAKEKITPGKIKKNQVMRERPSGQEYNQATYRQEANERDFSQQQQELEQGNVQESQEQNEIDYQVQMSAKEEMFRKTLGYFKTQEMCYRGSKTSQAHRSAQQQTKQRNQNFVSCQQNTPNMSQIHKDGLKSQNEELQCGQRMLSKQNSQQSSFSPKGVQAKKAEKVKQEESQSGWRTESNRSQSSVISKGPEDQECEEGQVEVKNSLDQEIEMNNRLQEQEEKSLHEEQNNQMKTQMLVKDPQQLPEDKRPQTTKQIYSQSSSKQIQVHQKQEEIQNAQPIQNKQTGSIAGNYQNHQKLNESISQKSKLQQKKANISDKKAKQRKVQQTDVASLITKQYSLYLIAKISANFAKEILVEETSAVQNEEQKPSSTSSNIQQMGCFTNFNCPIEEGKIERPQQGYDEMGEQEVSEINKQQTKIVNSIEKPEKLQSKQNPFQIQTKQVKNTVISKQAELTTIVPVQQYNPSVVQKISKPQVKEIPKTTVQGNKVIANEAKSASIAQAQQQSNNVYADTKIDNMPTSKFVQMGVQKELTMQVSIQTDHAFTNKQEPRIQSKKSTRRDQFPKQPEENPSEFEGTVRNNYLFQTKSSFRKQKKQMLRAAIINQIKSASKAKQMEKFQNIISNPQFQVLKEQNSVKMSEIYPQGIFMNERSLEVDLVKTKYHNFLKVLEILVERGQWIITRLFQDPKGLLQEKAFGVWLCKNFEWQCFIIDDCVSVNESNGHCTLHEGNQKWANVLEKALSMALGGTQQLQKADCGEIFTLLTGCNYLGVRIKQDPTKNAKVLQMISECQRKNYIVHAEKRNNKPNENHDRQSIFYLLSVRRSNGEEQALVELSQDGRESFWMRLSKFAQEFTRIQVLQLRVNHIFTHIDINTAKETQMTVIQLNFAESGQGCVTLSYIDHIAPLCAYLYKEEKSKVLKLVGQARQKQKSHLFFECNFNEGRYFIFVQSKERQTRLSYFGQNQPMMRVTQEIHNEGLKNQVAQYLPVHEQKESKPKRSDMQSTWNDWKYGKTPRLKDNFMQSRLREDFVEYILGVNRRKQVQS